MYLLFAISIVAHVCICSSMAQIVNLAVSVKVANYSEPVFIFKNVRIPCTTQSDGPIIFWSDENLKIQNGVSQSWWVFVAEYSSFIANHGPVFHGFINQQCVESALSPQHVLQGMSWSWYVQLWVCNVLQVSSGRSCGSNLRFGFEVEFNHIFLIVAHDIQAVITH